MTNYDLVIIGGGINGCGIARDAAGRGLRVLLCEKGDLASGTSSASSKLVHGGLRYLERGEFRLVRESLSERETLLRIAPHIIRPMRFVLPQTPGMRPAWLIGAGLLLYDCLGGRRLSATRRIDLRADPTGAPLSAGMARGYEYSDCWVDDVRLVVLNAVDAAERDADIRPRTKCTAAEPKNGVWHAQLTASDGAKSKTDWVTAHALVNATGPWCDEVRAMVSNTDKGEMKPSVRLVRGSHIVVPKLFDIDNAFVLQNRDRRVVFAIPYQNDYTLIGTTECDHDGGANDAAVSEEEIAYLLDVVGRYFKKPCGRRDIVFAYSGIRALFNDGADDPSRVTRDYVLLVESAAQGAPVLHVLGGKITTYRKLAESALAHLAHLFPGMKSAWTGASVLPGGDFAPNDSATNAIDREVGRLRTVCAGLDEAQARRMVCAYGTRAHQAMGYATDIGDLGEHFGGGLHAREAEYLMHNEWAQSADDILWRRGKFGLTMSDAQKNFFEGWIANAHADPRNALLIPHTTSPTIFARRPTRESVNA